MATHDPATDRRRTPDPAVVTRFVSTSIVKAVKVVELHLPQVLDSDAFDQLNAMLLAEMEAVGSGRCVLDLTDVQYMGSSMLGLMVNARQRVKAAGGKLVLCGMSDWLVQTFRTCSLEKLFVTAPERADALKLAERK
jgi:anti-anti-sigma factor